VRTVRKVVAYVTTGPRLLVFRHTDYPEAGVPVPAGMIRDEESPEEAVLREAHEETGLDGLKLVRRLGRQQLDMSRFGKREIQDRTFFHLTTTAPGPELWPHEERDPFGDEVPVRFECFWASLPDGVPTLAGAHPLSRTRS
jgi:8-oxo-dGTP pyrophosphatase MutT (NUDIX family)